ncbi:unnamed protein product [Paramecium pentaurelia]|uniref:PH domain-containing protein n=1 Tax=Paramecium pentaurelia TaxID=43138 RepID=A0A8S1YFR2_9CILI|nr:unnamed protein product [Paramecium pentaurelia]
MNQQINSKYQFEDLKCIVKEGWMDKQSRFLKKWHKRWIVLTNFTLYTFKKQQQYNNPTEVIDLNQIVSIKQADDHELQKLNSITIQTHDSIFYLIVQDEQQQQQWISIISSQLLKLKNQIKLQQ